MVPGSGGGSSPGTCGCPHLAHFKGTAVEALCRSDDGRPIGQVDNELAIVHGVKPAHRAGRFAETEVA